MAIVAAAPLLVCASTSSPIASAPTKGTSPLRTTTGASGSICSAAARTAPPVPSDWGCTASSTPSGSTSRERAGGRVDHDDTLGTGAQSRAHRPQHHREHRTGRAIPWAWPSACACPARRRGSGRWGRPRGHHSRCPPRGGRRRCAPTGEQGLEPGFSGPKSAVLPLADSPRSDMGLYR